MKHLSTLLIATTALMTCSAGHAADMKFDFTEADIIREQPAGTKLMYSKAASYYASSLFGIAEGSTDGMPCTVVEGADGAFYIYAPFAGLDTQSWLRADINGDKMTINLPQAIYADSDGTTDYVYVAQKCYFEYTDPENTEGLYYAYDGPQEIVFNREGDTWVMQGEEVTGHPVIMGLVSTDDGTWCTYSDWNIRLTPFTQEPLTPPASLQTEDWVLSFPNEDGKYLSGVMTRIGRNGDDVWMTGFSSSFPDAWIKGSEADGKITFPSSQYLGANENTSSFGYFFGATSEKKYNEEWDFWYDEIKTADDFVLTYDDETSTYTSDGILLVNKGKSEVNTIDIFTTPHMKRQGLVTDYTPMNLEPGFFTEPGDYAGSLYFDFPNLNTDGQILDTDNLFYRVYVDGEPFVLYSDEYEGVTDGTVDIPFNFSNQSTIGFYGTADRNHFFYFTFTGYETLAVRSLYRHGENEYLSDLMYVVGGEGDGVNNVSGAEIADEEWFDLTGCRVTNPEGGIFIHRVTYTDGTVKSFKTVK